MSGRLYAYHNDDRAPWGYAMTMQAPSEAPVGAQRATLAWILAIMTLGYLLPWAVATGRHRDDADTVGLVNLVVGWTVVGWFAALAMALKPLPA